MSIQYFEHPLAQGISTLGSAIGKGIETYGQRKHEQNKQQQQRQLQFQQMGALSDASQAAAEVEGDGLAKVGAFQQSLKDSGVQIDPATSVPYLKLIGGLSNKNDPFEGQSVDQLNDLFIKFGMDKESAERYSKLYPNLSIGGKTKFIDHFFDEISRGSNRGQLFGGISPSNTPLGSEDLPSTQPGITPQQDNQNLESPTQDLPVVEEEKFNFPSVDEFEGLNSKERVKRQSELGKENHPIYQDVTEKLVTLDRTERFINQLTNLNNGGKLPTGIEKFLKVDWKKGFLRLPATANEETQLFVKTINEFIKGAKDSFGARVTNFELDTFLQGLPTLANTESGRRLILKQMDIINKLTKLEKDSLKKVYRKYGRGNISSIKADEIAEQMREPEEKKLIDDFYRVPQEQKIYEAKKNTPSGKVAVELAGKYGHLTEEAAIEAESRGGRRL